jgi:hypothetical protein
MTDRELLELVAQKVNSMDQRMDSIDGKIISINQNMITKADLNQAITESQKDILAMLQHVEKKLDNHAEQMEAKFEVLNNRLFNQETELRLLKKQAQ